MSDIFGEKGIVDVGDVIVRKYDQQRFEVATAAAMVGQSPDLFRLFGIDDNDDVILGDDGYPSIVMVVVSEQIKSSFEGFEDE